MTPRDRLDERYQHDAAFHAVVDMLSKCIEDMQLSPSEVREAAMYAVYRSECRRPGLIGPISELSRELSREGPYR